MFKVLEIEKRKRMRVIKRNGKYEKVMFDKVLRRIMNLANSSRGKLDSIENVEPDIISQKVISRIYDEITTSELDELAARLSISMGTVHPDYDILATRIIISNNHKSTPSTFSDCIKKLYSKSCLRSHR